MLKYIIYIILHVAAFIKLNLLIFFHINKIELFYLAIRCIEEEL